MVCFFANNILSIQSTDIDVSRYNYMVIPHSTLEKNNESKEKYISYLRSHSNDKFRYKPYDHDRNPKDLINLGNVDTNYVEKHNGTTIDVKGVKVVHLYKRNEFIDNRSFSGNPRNSYLHAIFSIELPKTLNENSVLPEISQTPTPIQYEIETDKTGFNNKEIITKQAYKKQMSIATNSLIDHTYCLKVSNHVEVIQSICEENKVDCCRRVFIINEYLKMVEIMKKFKEIINKTKQNKSCPLKTFCYYFENYNLLFCNNSWEYPRSLCNKDFLIKSYVSMLFLFRKGMLWEDLYRLLRKIKRKQKVFLSASIGKDKQITCGSLKIPVFTVTPLFSTTETTQSKFKIMKFLFFIDQSKESLSNFGRFKDSDYLIDRFSNLREKYIKFRCLLYSFNVLEKTIFLEEYKKEKEHGFLSILNSLLCYLESEQDRILHIINDQCSNDTNLIYFLFYRYGNLLVNRLSIISKDPFENIYVVETFQKFVKAFEKSLAAVEMLKLSEQVNTNNTLSPVYVERLLHLLMCNYHLQMYRGFLIYIAMNSRTIERIIDVYINNGTNNSKMWKEVKIVQKELDKIDSMINMALRFLCTFKKNKEYCMRIFMLQNMIVEINKRITKIDKYIHHIQISNEIKIEEEERLKRLQKEITNLYCELFKNSDYST